MAYTRLHWVESETPLSADNMNNIEDGIEELKAQKVDKVSGKALSDQNYTAAEKTKLAGIEAGAEVNVQPDWSQSNSSADDYIQNKPGNATTSVAGFMSAADKSKLDGVQAGAQVNRTYTAATGKPTAAASPAFGGTVTVSQVSQSTTGQVSVTDRVITIPSSDATTSAHGLMSAADKTKLNGIAAGAQVNPGNATTSAAGLMSAADKTKLNGVEAGAQANRTYTAVTGKPTANQTASFGGFVTVSQAEQDATGQISFTDRRITFPGSTASTSSSGLMSASDKIKLDGIASGAQVNSITGVKGGAESSYRTGNVNITPANIGSYAKAESLTLGTVVSKSFTTTNQTYTLTSDAYVYFGGTSTSRVEVLQVNCLINGTVVACQSVFLDSLGTDAPVYSSILLKKGTQIQYKKILLADYTGATDSVSLKICPIS